MNLDEALRGATVLVADDHEPNLALMERVLRAAGVAEVHLTSRARDVLDLFRAVSPDIVLLDLHMPELDGVAVMEEIRRSTGPDDFVPIIVLTADATQHARERVLDAGANDYLTKPINQREVILRVRNLLHTRGLHVQLRSHNAVLQAENDVARAREAMAEARAAEKRQQVRAALDADQPRMVYQPIVELQTGAVIGYEALARFDMEPQRPPNEWFDRASEVGLAVELELAAIRSALRHARSVHVPLLSLNLSPETVASPELIDLLGGRSADRVAIELTEHTRVDDYDALLAALAPLRSAGALLAVDDAGAGFASLAHILRLDPDIIKLDIALVREIDRDPIKRALASSLVSFAGEIGAQIVAEGIETADECRELTALGIAWGQGYHLGRPAPLPDPDLDASKRPDAHFLARHPIA